MNTENLSARLRGPLILPDDDRYDAARAVYNAMHDRRPAMIVQAADTADVVAAVDFAREQELLLAVRGGGHSVPGYGTCDGGLVLDLGGMNHVFVDPAAKRVRAGGGCTLADLDHATHAFGLAVPSGTVSSTGVAGLTLGGGIGHLTRRFGLGCDNLVEAEVVTAAGEILTCDAERHPDLFWGLRGGGGNFGIVTSFVFDGHPVQSVFAGPTFFDVDGDVLRGYEALIRKAPEALNALCAFAQAPPAPFVPEARHGSPVIAVLACWSGPEQEDDSIPEMIADLGEVVGQHLQRMPYPAVNMFFDDLLPAGLRHYWKARSFDGFSEAAVAAHLEHGPQVPTLESGIFMMPTNGACGRVDEDATAFAHRGALLSAVISGSWHEPRDDEAIIRWVRDYDAALAPTSKPGAYLNFMSADDQQKTKESYGDKLQRLKAVKRQYDPDNLFRVNQNIEP